MQNMLEKIKKYFRKKGPETDRRLPFKVIFSRFRQVLDSNNRALEIMADMGDKLGGDYIFDINYIKSSYSEFADTMFKSIYNLNTLSQNKYLYLHRVFDRINDQVNRILQGKTQLDLKEPVLFYRNISWEMTDEVGGKNAGLAELSNYLKLNVPDGFAITTSAFMEFMEYNHIEEKIDELKKRYRKGARRFQKEDMLSAITFAEAGEHETAGEILREEEYLDESFFMEVQKIISKGKLPSHLETALEKGLERLRGENGTSFFIAVRSSAEKEDLEYSFAGQFETVLNVPSDITMLAEAYKKVLASLYSPGSIVYMKQIMPEGKPMMAMSVGCVRMVDALASGVMYSMDPNDLDREVVIINANWGLGTTVVEGSVDADHYLVERTESYNILEKKTGKKEVMVVAGKDGGVNKVSVPAENRMKQCVTDEQIKNLARQAMLIEHYMKKPQDIEWAIDKNGEIFILQARPLRIANKSREMMKDISSSLQKYTVLMENQGIIARRGIGAGKVFVLERMEDLKEFSHGSVLVAKHDSSQFIKVMPKAAAIITDIGTPTSHMANIAREFQVPTIVNTGTGTTTLKQGEEVTVDADDNKIYAGIIKELLRYTITEELDLTEAKEFRVLKKILRYITPLNLIDPLLDNFTPEGCQTFHDIIRFIHEKAIAELVDVERYKEALRDVIAVKLDIQLPTGIFIIDIGGGLNLKEGHNNKAIFDEINSIPFKAIISGMMHPGVWHSQAVSMKINDFMSSMMKMPDVSSMRYLGENVAVVSREYVNLSLRFGYHFNMVDCYCSENVRDNHVYFRFVGGATDIAKRSRRAELLAAILKEYNMRINAKGDLIIARTDNISRSEMEVLLDHLGRLIAYSRQLDALLDDDRIVQHYVRNFLEGRYNLEE
jgi:pyruvate,water dikinase